MNNNFFSQSFIENSSLDKDDSQTKGKSNNQVLESELVKMQIVRKLTSLENIIDQSVKKYDDKKLTKK